MILLGIVALVGLAPRSGWLTRLAGVLGIAGFVLVMVQMFRASGDQTPGPGAWLCLAGGIAALIGGFLGTRRRTEVVEERLDPVVETRTYR
jgi:peptidoglycan/LPS O-acetylase OafA/YrhL